MRDAVDISPFRCRMWRFHDRLEDDLSAQSCSGEISSFEKHGQQIPVLGRAVPHELDYDYELICGARRLFVARYLNVPIKVEVADLTDREAIIAMDIENRQRQAISPYEQGVSYRRWLEEGVFESQTEMARALDLSPARLCRLLKLAQLPRSVLNAFPDPREVPEKWGLQLVSSMISPEATAAVREEAARIASDGSCRSAKRVFKRLLASCTEAEPTSGDSDVVKGPSGEVLFTIKYRRRSVMIVLGARCVSRAKLRRIEGAIAHILDRESAQESRIAG